MGGGCDVMQQERFVHVEKWWGKIAIKNNIERRKKERRKDEKVWVNEVGEIKYQN